MKILPSQSVLIKRSLCAFGFLFLLSSQLASASKPGAPGASGVLTQLAHFKKDHPIKFLTSDVLEHPEKYFFPKNQIQVIGSLQKGIRLKEDALDQYLESQLKAETERYHLVNDLHRLQNGLFLKVVNHSRISKMKDKIKKKDAHVAQLRKDAEGIGQKLLVSYHQLVQKRKSLDQWLARRPKLGGARIAAAKAKEQLWLAELQKELSEGEARKKQRQDFREAKRFYLHQILQGEESSAQDVAAAQVSPSCALAGPEDRSPAVHSEGDSSSTGSLIDEVYLLIKQQDADTQFNAIL